MKLSKKQQQDNYDELEQLLREESESSNISLTPETFNFNGNLELDDMDNYVWEFE